MTALIRFFTRLWLWSGLYHWWSRFYRWAKERRWRHVTMPRYETLQVLEDDLGEMRWTEDGSRRWYDTISAPKAAWGRHKAGGSAGDCLPVGTLLLTSDYRFVPIEQISAGDEIIGDGVPTRVRKSWSKGTKCVLRFGLNNGCSLTCTPDHRVFVRRGPRGGVGPVKPVVEVRANDVRVGDILLQPRSTFPCTKGRVTKDEAHDAWVLGLYIADGWLEQGQRRFAISGKDGCPKETVKEELLLRLTRRGIRAVSSRRFIRVYDHMIGTVSAAGHSALEKQVPGMWKLRRKEVEELLGGIMADASTAASGTRTLNTVSTKLALQTRVLYRMLGKSTHMRLVSDHGGLGRNPIWRVTPRLGKVNRSKSLMVRSVEEAGEVPVWDVMTEDGYIYLPESDVVVHNCDDISVYAADRLADMADRGELAAYGVLDRSAVGLLTCVWLRGRRAAGHNVCAFWYVDPADGERKWAHVSNWFDGAVQHGFGSIEDVFRSVCEGGVGEPLAWTWATPGKLRIRRRG